MEPMPVRRTITSTEPGAVVDAKNWRWQLRNAIRDPDTLARRLRMEPGALAGIRQATETNLPLLITPYFLALCDPDDPQCPIRLQCIPNERECESVQGELADPLGEQEHQVAPSLIRRYPDRVLLIATLQCATHCRFCTRSRLVRTQGRAVPMAQLELAFQWLRDHPEVREVLLSGGDPLTMSTARLVALVRSLRAIRSVELIRIATRAPAVLPMRINAELLDALTPLHPIWFMVHFNHPRELTEEARCALRLMADRGYPVMSQTVLLRGVNDDARVLAELFRTLVTLRVRPYYLLHGDVVCGTSHLRTTVQQSIELFGQMQGTLSGIALPKLVIDSPGGKGKVPVGPETIVTRSGRRTTLRTFRGETVDILDPPRNQTR